MELKSYSCTLVEPLEGGVPWGRIEPMALSGVVAGESPRLRTGVKACWTRDALHIRFECEDDHIVAGMTNRDDPLYDEDVVEIFIDERGTGERYMELEISPRNTIFDAMISNDLKGSIQVDTGWDAEGLETSVTVDNDIYVYDVVIPFVNFHAKPDVGTSWRWNVYRIDADPQGRRHFWAWAPTGAIDYHLTSFFGRLFFVSA
ncbi:carbohydrate-binding family 9-like protein [Paenibacillus thermotolerans]|uniref:carbohydrate-binding family 9-like protein n=1 Tax=Paenibacillus thermotolerans TaxID=3027807 RepID=UPI002367E4C3|nr:MULTISPECIES: carbohydrate-binding family 9-like protein [unclassified Paenibacillus]